MIHLEKITMTNFRDVLQIKINDEDKKMVASNMYSLAEAYADQVSIPRAIYQDEALIGFIMYNYSPKEKKGYVDRLMISSDEQGKGYGSTALQIVVQELLKEKEIEVIQISYMPQNDKARYSYKKIGFIEVDEFTEGEQIAYYYVKR